MPKQIQPKVTITSYLPVPEAERLMALAQRLGVSRAKALSRVILLGLSELDRPVPHPPMTEDA